MMDVISFKKKNLISFQSPKLQRLYILSFLFLNSYILISFSTFIDFSIGLILAKNLCYYFGSFLKVGSQFFFFNPSAFYNHFFLPLADFLISSLWFVSSFELWLITLSDTVFTELFFSDLC